MCFDYWLIWGAAAPPTTTEKNIFNVYHTHKILWHYLYRIDREKKCKKKIEFRQVHIVMIKPKWIFGLWVAYGKSKKGSINFFFSLLIPLFHLVVQYCYHYFNVYFIYIYMFGSESIHFVCRFNSLKFLFMYVRIKKLSVCGRS